MKASVVSQGFSIVLPAFLFLMSGCEVTGGYTMHVPGDAIACAADNDQISVVYQTSYVPNYLTVSVNNDQFVFDECTPSSTQDEQAEFVVRRGQNTEIQFGLHHGTTMRDTYFPGGADVPYRSDITVRVLGRSNCYVSPTTIVPTTTLGVSWQPQAATTCADDGYLGAAVIN
jgi:hypothetical protein